MKKIVLLSILLSITSVLQAQQGPVAGYGEATGSGGHVSYSIGQVFYSFQNAPGHNIVQGVQQPIEIYILGTTTTNIRLTCKVHPNPVQTYLQLSINQHTLSSLQYTLCDINGRPLLQAKIQDHTTHIPMGHFSSGMYLLQIKDNHFNTLQSFKIIKH